MSTANLHRLLNRHMVLLLIFLISFVFFNFKTSYSAYLTYMPSKITQPNGIVLECFLSGDEFYNWRHDKDGYTIVKNHNSHYFTYAVRSGDSLLATNYVYGVSNPEALGLKKWVKISVDRIMNKRQAFRRHFSKPIINKKNHQQTNNTGTIRNVVIYIRFHDETEFTDDTSTYDVMFNSASGNSMYSYYREATYQQLSIFSSFYPIPTNNIVKSYQDSHDRNFFQPYDPNDNPNGYTQSNKTTREQTLLQNAVEAVRSDIPSSLAIDNDNDGYVDNVCFIISGDKDSWSDLLWPHMWTLWSKHATINGKRVWTYNFQIQDFLKNYGNGVLSHEMFHTLGAPDLYHYNQDNLQPVGPWDIMANTTTPPQHMGAWMKKTYGGWISSIPEITSGGTYSLNPLTSSTNNCYKIASPNSTTEYFLLEYRKKNSTFESGIPGSGLLVYRITPDSVPNGNMNGPQDEVYIYRPGGDTTTRGNPSNAFFSSTVSRTQINDITSPSSFLSNGTPGGLNIYDIGTAGNTITFKVGMGFLPPELVSPDDGVGSISIAPTLIWSNVDDPTSYDVQISTNSSFSSTIFNQTVTDTFATVSPNLNYGTLYYWRVASKKASETSDWSVTRSYSTMLEKPVLTSPNDNVFEILLTDTLNWQSVTGANNYTLEIATNSGFSPVLFQQASISTNSFVIPDGVLENNTLYYWHIKAVKTSPQTESNWSDSRIFNTILASPELLIPNNDSLGIELAGNLSWNSVSGASAYNIQLSDDLNFTTSLIDTTGITSTTLPFDSLDYNGDYYWRAQAINPQQSSLWSNAYHFRTILQVPVLSQPLNTGGGVQIDAHLYWHPVDGADSYGVQVSSDTTMSDSLVFATDINDTSYICSGLDSKSKYFWRVFASSNDGRVSQWSTIWSFETILGSPYIPSPNDSADGIPVNGVLVWNDVTGAEHYHIQLSSNKNFTDFNLNDSTITATSVSYFNLTPNENYYWHVRALTSSNSGNWSKTWQFKTGLSGVVLLYPTDDSRGIPINGSLRWQDMPGADSYRVQLSKEQNFSTTIIDDSSITGSSKAFSNLESNVRYYWRVNSKNSSGISDWSEIWHFTTTAGEPELLYPDNNSGGLKRTDTLIWSSTPGANNYHLQIAEDLAMSNIIHEEHSLTDTLFVYSGLDFFKTYYWRVQATNNDGTSPWSEIRNYTTIVSPPDLSYPLNDSYDIVSSDNFKWLSPIGADKYTLWVSEKNTFETKIIEEDNINTTKFDYSGFEHNKTYFWKVRAGNDDAMGDWSEIWHFRTKLASPVLDSPKDSSEQIPISGQARWYAVDGYESYRIQISKQSDFKSLSIDTSGLVFAQYDYANLDQATTYFWRVNSSNSKSTGNWSDVWQFTSLNPNPVIDNNTYGISFRAYPNPMSENTIFEYSINNQANIIIRIYNELGNKVDELHLGQMKSGDYSSTWIPNNIPNGIYNAVLSVDKYSLNLKIIIMK